MTQNEKIKRHLEKFGRITSLEAFTEYGCTRLSARILDLRKKYGMHIVSKWGSSKNRFGEPVNYVVYHLDSEEHSNDPE